MIFVFAEGGTGSVYFSRCVRVAPRPDTVFGFEPDLKALPDPACAVAFRARSGVDLDPEETIEENLARMLEIRENELNLNTMLSGRGSQGGRFLTENGIRATCFVRHPLHAFASFLGHRHPVHAARFGGYQTEEAVFFYARIWNAMVSDFISSGNRIHRFEYLPSGASDPWLRRALAGWNNTLRHHSELSKELETKLKSLVYVNYYKLYMEWKI